MYKRDLGILLLAAFAVYLTLEREGPFSFRKAWFHSTGGTDSTFGAHLDALPPAVVADLNGDGVTEVLIATHDASIQVLAPRPPGRAGEGFAPAGLIAEVSLLPGRIRLAAGRKAVAMAAGYLDPAPVELVLAPRKKVVAVVTAGWHLMVFDHNLKLMWEKNIKDKFPPHGVIDEVAIHISEHCVDEGDRGMIIVAGSVDQGDIVGDEDDDFAREMRYERERQRGAREDAPTRRGAVRGVAEGMRGGVTDGDAADVSRHFSYYAYEGAAGEERWSHEGKDFHRDAAQLAEVLIPQHNYRLEAESLNNRHYGEVSCREYRESLLREGLPHRWTTRADTHIRPAHFSKARGSRAAKESAGGTDATGSSTLRQHKARQKAHKGVHVGHGNGDLPPNVLIAHMREGIEVVALYTGRSICKLHLPQGGLHVDLNGDGVLDHLAAVGGDHDTNIVDSGHVEHSFCWASVTSGIPPQEPLFNGTICRSASRLTSGNYASRAFGRGSVGDGVEIAPPAMLPLPRRDGSYRAAGQHGHAVFLNSRGEVTSYAPTGKKMFQIQAGTGWHNIDGDVRRIVPTLRAIPLRHGAIPTAILAVGQSQAVVLSENANKLDSLELPGPPAAQVQVVDFNGDSLNDLILTTDHGVFGYAQVRRPGGMGFGILVACLLIAMGVIYYTTQTGPTVAQRKAARSTERVD